MFGRPLILLLLPVPIPLHHTNYLSSTDQAQDQYNQINNATDASHHSSIGHEALGGAAAFAAMKFFEDHQRKAGAYTHPWTVYSFVNGFVGKPIEHSLAKEILAGFAGAAVDGLVESKGLDFIDKQKAKHQAKQQAEKLYDSHYSDKSQYDP